jgi:hypothetical protein
MANKLPVYYLCGICGAHHPWRWNGDCRDNTNRFTYEQLDTLHGSSGWDERSTDEREREDGFGLE